MSIPQAIWEFLKIIWSVSPPLERALYVFYFAIYVPLLIAFVVFVIVFTLQHGRPL